MNGPVTLLFVFSIVGLVAVAVRIGSVEHRQRIRRELREERRAQAEWERFQRDSAPTFPRVLR